MPVYDASPAYIKSFLQRLLGHADAQTAMRVYTHLSQRKEQQSIDALNAHIEQKSPPLKTDAEKIQ